MQTYSSTFYSEIGPLTGDETCSKLQRHEENKDDKK